MILFDNLKDFVLNNYKQELLFAKYFNIDESDVVKSIKLNRPIINTLRGNDTKPSLLFSVKGNKIKMWDFGSPLYRGDIFHLVGIIINRNSNKPKDFVDICKYIISNNIIDNETLLDYDYKKESHIDISYIPLDFNKSDIAYWELGNISKKHLSNRSVLKTKNVVLKSSNGVIDFYNYDLSDPAYIYFLGYDKKELLKIYRPFTKNNYLKFRTNNKYVLEGIPELYESETLIITKSRKDKLVLESYIGNGEIVKKVSNLISKLNIPPYIIYPFSFGFYEKLYNIDFKYCVTNISSEGILINKPLFDLLKSKHKRIVLNFDYDLTGITNSYIYYNLYNIDTLFIGRSSINIVNSISSEILSLISNKFDELGLTFNYSDFINYINKHSNSYIEKDWFELSSSSKQSCKSLINEYYR